MRWRRPTRACGRRARPGRLRARTDRGLELTRRSEAVAYWECPLLKNLGWELSDAGEHAEALEVFERALEVRLRDAENPQAIEHAREAVAEARKTLGLD